MQNSMYGRFLLVFAVFLGFGLCPLSSLALQRSGSQDLPSVHVNRRVLELSHGGKRLLLHIRELQVVKTESEKPKVVQQTGNKDETIVARTGSGDSSDPELSTGDNRDNTTKQETKPGNLETHSTNMTSVPPPASVEGEDGTHIEGNNTDSTKFTPKMEESAGHSIDNGTKVDVDHQTASSSCGGSHCEDPKKLTSACLTIPGDGAHQLSLFITYVGKKNVMVKVAAPEFLIADPGEVLISAGKSETIHFLMDPKHKETLLKPDAMENKTIVVSSVYGACEVAVPADYLRNSIGERESQLPLMEPKKIGYLLAFVFVLSCVGAWLCYKFCGKKRAGAVKYQQLEMNGLTQSSPKQKMEERGTDSWDEVWDDHWEDAEAAKSSSSRLGQSLSSRSLAARRGTKDGWDD